MAAKPGFEKKAGKAAEALAMLDGVDVALLALDADSRVTCANRIASEFFGRQGGSLVGVSLHDLLEACLQHPFTFDKFYSRVSTTGKAGELEVPVHHFRWALFRLYPVDGGGMNVMVEDVTHRRMRDEPQRAALLTFNSLPEAVFLVYENGGIYYANEAACCATGYTLEELKTLRASAIIPDLDPWVLKHNGKPAPESARFESVLQPKAGDPVPVEVCVTGKTMFRRTNYIISVHDIAERKKAQEKLVRLEGKTRDLLNRAPTGIYELDFRGPRFLMVNDFVCEATGYTREELMAMSPFDLLADESEALFRERIRRQLAGEKVDDTVKYQGKVKDGREMYWVLKVTFTYDAGGQPVGAIVVGNDITERRRAEVNEERLRALVDHTPSLVFLKDELSRYVYLNSAYEKHYALSRDWYGKTDFDFWPRESAELFRANDAEVMESGQTCQYLEDSTDLQGNRHSWLVYKFPYTDSQGNRFVGGIGTDVIDRVRAEEALRESEVSLARAQAIAHLANWEVDIGTNLVRGSEELYRMFNLGWDVPLDAYVEKFHPDDRARIVDSINASIYDGKPYNIDYRIIPRQGVVRQVHAEGETIHDGAGRPVTFFGTILDVTDRRRAEEALEEAKAQAELYLDLMGHDINNMNMVAAGFLEMARAVVDTDGKLDSSKVDLLDNAMASINSSSRLIGNVRKLQQGRMGEYMSEVYDLGALVGEVCEEYRSTPDRQVSISFRMVRGVRVEANELLRDVFANLISNAIKHTRGPASINVSMNAENMDGRRYCSVSVEDNGPGIPDAMKAVIFDRFRQGDTKAHGTGLGLYLVKSLVDSYGGRVWVEDQVKGDHTKGARFVVMLPANDK